jgi:hypothetical protein
MGFRARDVVSGFVNEVVDGPKLALERSKIVVNDPNAVLPELLTGARAVLLIDGKPVGAAMEVNYRVTTQSTDIRTIDQFMPWEIVPGQMQVSASLRRVVDPNRTLGSDGLFSTMQAYLHQPYGGIELRDKLGNLIFYARGMFTEMQGVVQAGQMGMESVNFVGYYWRENVRQEYDPEQSGEFLDKLKNTFSKNSLVRQFG